MLDPPSWQGARDTAFHFFFGLPLQGLLRPTEIQSLPPWLRITEITPKAECLLRPRHQRRGLGAQRGSSSPPCDACSRADQKLAPERPVKRWAARSPEPSKPATPTGRNAGAAPHPLQHRLPPLTGRPLLCSFKPHGMTGKSPRWPEGLRCSALDLRASQGRGRQPELPGGDHGRWRGPCALRLLPGLTCTII